MIKNQVEILKNITKRCETRLFSHLFIFYHILDNLQAHQNLHYSSLNV